MRKMTLVVISAFFGILGALYLVVHLSGSECREKTRETAAAWTQISEAAKQRMGVATKVKKIAAG